jgi:hypothetical protein
MFDLTDIGNIAANKKADEKIEKLRAEGELFLPAGRKKNSYDADF